MLRTAAFKAHVHVQPACLSGSKAYHIKRHHSEPSVLMESGKLETTAAGPGNVPAMKANENEHVLQQTGGVTLNKQQGVGAALMPTRRSKLLQQHALTQ
jgi:hypothetical protein